MSPGINSRKFNLREPNFRKISYLKHVILLRRVIKDFSPDIMHAHYLSSYGLLGYLSGFKPLIASAWGSDVYYFPQKSYLHNLLVKIVVNKANIICSSSKVMADLIKKNYGRSDVIVVPFGVDTNFFKPKQIPPPIFKVGTIKSIENHNGIDCLIDSAKIIIHEYKKNIIFDIIGKGTLMEKMQKKVKDYDLEDNVNFFGYIKHHKTIDYFNDLSIFVAVSLRESFGVSVLEAAACGIPAITSNIGGLIEVNLHEKTGIVIDANNPQKLADAIMYLHSNDDIRKKMGKAARQRVKNNFNWQKNVALMLSIYQNYTQNDKKN